MLTSTHRRYTFSAKTKKVSSRDAKQIICTSSVRTVYDACNRHNRTEYQYGTLHIRAHTTPAKHKYHTLPMHTIIKFSQASAVLLCSRSRFRVHVCERVRGLNSMQSVCCMQIALTHPCLVSVPVAQSTNTRLIFTSNDEIWIRLRPRIRGQLGYSRFMVAAAKSSVQRNKPLLKIVHPAPAPAHSVEINAIFESVSLAFSHIENTLCTKQKNKSLRVCVSVCWRHRL